MNNRADALSLSGKLVNGPEQTLLPSKVFAQPFRLAFKKDDDVIWLEVRSLEGLRQVATRLDEGEIQEIDRFSTLEMQLWGLLAEHAGFLRIQGCASALAAGIQPLGEQTAALAEDISSIMGGDDVAALNMLNTMKSALKSTPFDDTLTKQTTVSNEFVKSDGVNYTEKGEDTLREMVLGRDTRPYAEARKPSKETIEHEKVVENAIQIFRETPEPTEEEREWEASVITECGERGEGSSVQRNAVPPTEEPKVGPAAARIGRLVADVARGLDNEADAAVRSEAEAAIQILTEMMKRGASAIEGGIPLHDVEKFTSHYGTSIDELKTLIVEANQASKGRARNQARAETYTEARKNQERNFLEMLAKLTEVDLCNLVDQSQAEPFTPEEQNPHDEAVKKTVYVPPIHPLNFVKEPDQPYGSDHYKEREVTPADPDPRGELQPRRGPASMDVYRTEEQRQDPSYGSTESKSNDSGETDGT